MGLTNFPNGITSMGVPVLGSPGFMSGGTHYFVDPANGSDGNTGLSWDKAKATLKAAYDLCTTGKNDVVYLISDGSTTATARITSASLTWSKNATHLIGVCAPSKMFQRARISHSATSGVGVTPLMTVSGNGCLFQNLSFFQGYASDVDQNAVVLTGSRNCFQNVHFGGGGHATPAARAGTTSLTITAASENAFIDCVFGLTSIFHSAANAQVVVTASNLCRDNYFDGCTFVKWTDDSSSIHVNVGSSSLLGFMIFRNCMFINNVGTSGGTTIDAALTVSATCGGDVILYNPMFVGATDITAADSARTHVLGFGANPSGNLNVGLAVTTDVS